MNQQGINLRDLPPVIKLDSLESGKLPEKGTMVEINTNEIRINPYPEMVGPSEDLGKIKLVIESVGPLRIFFISPETGAQYFMDRKVFISANGSIAKLDEVYIKPETITTEESAITVPVIGKRGTIEKTNEEILDLLNKAQFTRPELDRIFAIAQRINTYSSHDQNKIKELIVVCLKAINPNDYYIRKFISLAGNLKIQESIDMLVEIALNQNTNYEVVSEGTVQCVRTALTQISSTGLIILRQAAIKKNNAFLLNILEKAKDAENGNDSLKALLGREVNFKSIKCSLLENGTMVSETEREITDGQIISINSIKLCIRDKEGILYGVKFIDLPEGFLPTNNTEKIEEEKLDIIPEGTVVKLKFKEDKSVVVNGNESNIPTKKVALYKVIYSSPTSLSIQNTEGDIIVINSKDVNNFEYSIVIDSEEFNTIYVQINTKALVIPGHDPIILDEDKEERAWTIFGRLYYYLALNNLNGFNNEIEQTISRLDSSSGQIEKELASFYIKLKSYLFAKLGLLEPERATKQIAIPKEKEKKQEHRVVGQVITVPVETESGEIKIVTGKYAGMFKPINEEKGELKPMVICEVNGKPEYHFIEEAVQLINNHDSRERDINTYEVDALKGDLNEVEKTTIKEIANRNMEIMQQSVYERINIESNLSDLQQNLLALKARQQEEQLTQVVYNKEVNSIFEIFINTTFESIGQTFMDVDITKVNPVDGNYVFAKEGWPTIGNALEVEVWADHFLDYVGRVAISKAIDLLKEVCIQNGITNLNLDDWIGPQGVGKGTLLLTLKDVASKVKNENIAIDDTLAKLLDEIDNPNSDTIETGTGENGGIFNPSWRKRQGKPEKANPRYLPWESLGKAAGIPVGMGKLLSDNFTNLVCVVELTRSIALGKNRVAVDVWPRTDGQGKFVNEVLVNELDTAKINVVPSLLHVEAIDKKTADLIMANKEVSKKVYTFLSGQESLIVTNPSIVAENFIGNVFTKLGIDPKDDAEIEARNAEIRTEGNKMLNEFRDHLSKFLLSDSNIEALTKEVGEESTATAIEIYRSLVEGRAFSIKLIADRFAQIMRPDEGDISAVAKRLMSYDKDSAPAARDMGAMVVPGRGTPSEAIESMLIALVKERDPEYDTTNENFTKVVNIAKELHEGRVNIRKVQAKV